MWATRTRCSAFFAARNWWRNWRLTTARDQTVDEYGILTRNLFTLGRARAARNWRRDHQFGGAAAESDAGGNVAERILSKKALFVEPGMKTGMPVLYDNPQEVGADRIVNGVAAFEKYGGPCIVVDFGTAINFDVISARGEYLGGAIAPGIGISAEALFSRAAQTSAVEIKDPGKVIGTNTVAHMQAGLFYGTPIWWTAFLSRMKKELGATARKWSLPAG